MKRLAIFIFLLLAANRLMAESVLIWCAVTDTGTSIEVSKLGMLVSADDDVTFAVVANDGTILADGVSSIRFEQQEDVTAVKQLQDDSRAPKLLGSMVSGELILTGAKGAVTVFAANGVQMLKAEATDGKTRLNVQGLPHGVYVVKCGKASFKFIKK